MDPGKIPFFTDNMIAESVPRFLEARGHVVTRLRSVMLPDTKDPVIAFACSRAGQVLVTHDKDFKATHKRFNLTQRQYREELHRIILRCPEPQDVERLGEHITVIESEWGRLRDGHPLFVELWDKSIRVWR